MTYSSLPIYPPPLPSRYVGGRPKRDWRLTPRQARILTDLVWLAGIVVLLLWLRQTADAIRQPAPAPNPLPFKLVAERFARIHDLMPAREVFALLGPQQFTEFWEQEMEDYEHRMLARPDRYPGERYWAKWADPADPARWVAVLFSYDRVYRTFKRGL